MALGHNADRPSSRPAARRLATGCLLLILAGSVVTCRFDKLINPAIHDRLVITPVSVRDSANSGSSAEPADTLRITSADGATLPWTARVESAWLMLEPSSGSAPDTLIVKLIPGTLLEDVHQDTIFFTSPLAGGDTVRVPVSFTILPPAPELGLSQTTHADTAYARSALPDTFTLWVRNTGALPLTWSAALDTGWVALSDSGGSVPARDSVALLVTLRPDSLTAGAHHGTIRFTAPAPAIGSPADVDVTFTIQPCAQTSIVPDVVVAGAIALSDCGAPHRIDRLAKLYRFPANAGDTLSLRLTSPAFDAYLVLTDSLGASLAQNDDCPAFTGPACIVNFRAPAAGGYVVEVTTAAPVETGAFSFSAVRERAPGVPQQIGQFRGDSATPIAAGQVSPENVAVFKGRITDPNPADSVRLEVELTGVLGGLRTDSSAFVPVIAGGAVVAIRTAGLTDNEGYRWRARACDKTGRCSAWVGYGDPNPAVDFYVNHILQPPPAPTALNQFHGGAPIPPGGGTGGLLSTETVTFQGVVSDFDPGDVIALEVEARRTSQGFSGSGTLGVPVSSGNPASVSIGFQVPLLGTDQYHWRARACDQTSRCSAWVSFGGSDGSADFTVP